MENRCVSCGAIIPEGRMVCPECETSVRKPDLVDRSIIISRLKNSRWWQPADLHTALSCVEDAQEVKPRNNRRTGHWVYDPNANDWCIGGWCCSECHYKNDTLGISKKLHLPIRAIAGTRYCAQCGAKMSEEATE